MNLQIRKYTINTIIFNLLSLDGTDSWYCCLSFDVGGLNLSRNTIVPGRSSDGWAHKRYYSLFIWLISSNKFNLFHEIYILFFVGRIQNYLLLFVSILKRKYIICLYQLIEMMHQKLFTSILFSYILFYYFFMVLIRFSLCEIMGQLHVLLFLISSVGLNHFALYHDGSHVLYGKIWQVVTRTL